MTGRSNVQSGRHGGCLRVVRSISAAAGVIGFAVTVACDGRGPDRRVQDRDASPPVVSPGQIAEFPDKFVGRTVRVSDAEVEEIWTPRLFSLDEDEPGAAPDVLVLLPSPTLNIDDGERVTVVGTLRELSGAAFRKDYHWWDEGAFTTEIDMVGARPVLVASSVRTEDGRDLIDEKAARAQGTTGRSSEDHRHPSAPPRALPWNNTRPVTSVAPIAHSEASALVGRAVEIDGVQVAGSALNRGVWVQGPKGDRAFVLPGYGELRTPAKGERVAIDGVVFHMPDEMRRQLTNGGTGDPSVYIYAWDITQVGRPK